MNKLQHFIVCFTFIFAGLASTAHAETNWGGMLTKSFEAMGSNLTQIKRKTSHYSTTSWYRTSLIDVAAVGAGACAVPLSGMVALPAEFLYLIREIYNSSMGLGFLINGEANKDDFAIILGLWADEISLDNGMVHHAFELADASGIPEKAVMSLGTGGVVSQLLAKKTGAKVAGKLAAKIAAKAGAKISAKYAAKLALAWIPFVSAAACSGLNIWIMNGVLSNAEDYYQQLASVRKTRYSH